MPQGMHALRRCLESVSRKWYREVLLFSELRHNVISGSQDCGRTRRAELLGSWRWLCNSPSSLPELKESLISKANFAESIESLSSEELSESTCVGGEETAQQPGTDPYKSYRPSPSSGDARVIAGICDLLESSGWGRRTIDLLDKQWAAQLSPLVISRVILRQRKLTLSEKFFNWASSIVGLEPYSSHAYLSKLGEKRNFDSMWELVGKMYTGCGVNESTFCIMIKAYGAAGLPGKVFSVFESMADYNVVPDARVYTTILAVLFSLKLKDETLLWYIQMLIDGISFDKNIYSTLIRGFIVGGNSRDAHACFRAMYSEGVKPDISVFNGIIEGFCSVGAAKDAEALLPVLQQRGYTPNLYSFNLIIKAYCILGQPAAAIDVFAKMNNVCAPNQSTYNILLLGLVVNEQIPKAMKFFNLMETSGLVDAKSYVYITCGLRKVEQTSTVYDLLKGLYMKHGFANALLCNSFIYNLCALGRYKEAEEVFTGMVRTCLNPYKISYTIMIRHYCKENNLEKAMELLMQLKDWLGKPYAPCYNPVMESFLKVDRLADALTLLNEMLDMDLEVCPMVYNCLLQALCRQDRIDDVIKYFDVVLNNKLTMSNDTLFKVIKCLTKLGKAEVANALTKRILEEHLVPDEIARSQAMGVLKKMGSCF